MNVIIKQRLNDYIAYFEGASEWWGCGRTKTDAVEDLIESRTEIMAQKLQREINDLKYTIEYLRGVFARQNKLISEHCGTISLLRKEIEEKDGMLLEYRILPAEVTRRTLKLEKEVVDRDIELGRLSYLLDESRGDVGLREEFIREDRVEMKKLRSQIVELDQEIERLQTFFDKYQCEQYKQINRDGKVIRDLQSTVEVRNNKINKINNIMYHFGCGRLNIHIAIDRINKILKEE